MGSLLYSVAIVTHNNIPLTKKCIESVLRSTGRDRLEIIFVDNASTDGTRDYLCELITPNLNPYLKVLANDSNVGVGAAYNQALDFAQAPYFITLNNDIEILDPDWLEKMKACFDNHPRLALVGAEGTGCYLDSRGMGHPTGPHVDYVEGSCMMGRTELLRKEGLFDPAYRFAYCEDADLSLRLRKKGYQIKHIPLKMMHVRSATSDQVRDEIDIEGFHAFNHMVLISRWHKYLETRSFAPKEGISIKRTGAMGDVLWMTPVIRQMKRDCPELKIHVYTEYPEILRGNPDVASAGPVRDSFDEAENKIDLDLSYEMNPKQHCVLTYAEKCGVKITDWLPRVYLNDQEGNLADRIVGNGKWAALHVGPDDCIGRTLTPILVDRIVGYLSAHDWNIFPIQKGEYTFHELAAIISSCGLFVGADSLPMHLAQSARIPTVGIFGSISPENWLIPNVAYFKGVTADPMKVGCLGCHKEYPVPRTGPFCIRGGENTNLCMKRIDENKVFEAIEEVLGVGR
jgi:glycosyltransferase involved in cell wall biosynthesis